MLRKILVIIFFIYFSVTKDNKGQYFWPKTVAGHVVELPCESEISIGIARYNCTLGANWHNLNTSLCSFTSETTRILQQYAKVQNRFII